MPNSTKQIINALAAVVSGEIPTSLTEWPERITNTTEVLGFLESLFPGLQSGQWIKSDYEPLTDALFSIILLQIQVTVFP